MRKILGALAASALAVAGAAMAGSGPTSAATIPPVGGPTGITWAQTFSDPFNCCTLDLNKWSNMEGRTMNNVTAHASNITFTGTTNGIMHLRVAAPGSGAFISSAKADGAGTGYLFPVGSYIEARIKFEGSGADVYNWPAFWTSGPNWPAAGEHDIAEGLGTMTVNYHSPSGTHNQGTIPGTWTSAFHTYGLYRKANSAEVYYDGNLVKSYPTDDNGQPQSVLFNIGTHSSGNVYGAAGDMDVDYVRTWKPAP